jgi:hypothetical protein
MFKLSSYVCNNAGLGQKLSLTGNKFHSNIKRGRKKKMETMAKKEKKEKMLEY